MSVHGPLSSVEAPKGCRRCPRLAGLRKSLRKEHPDWWNAPVPAFGFVNGTFANDPDDGIALAGAIILNAVKCLPPENKPTGPEITNCRPYLGKALSALPNLQIILALGKVADDSILRLSGARLVDHKFSHGAAHQLPDGRTLIDSYHCSRYNVNTGRLTATMFEQVFEQAVYLSSVSRP